MGRIGEKIKDAREKKNIPIKQLAKKCGVSESYIADVESGRKVLNDSMIKTISNALDINLNEPLFIDEEIPEEEEAVKKPVKLPGSSKVSASFDTAPTADWQSAFSSILKDVPIYASDMSSIQGYKSLPIIDKKVEGHNPEKLIYIKAADNSMGGFRIKKNDLVMVILSRELSGSGLYLVEYGDTKAIRHVRRLDSNNLLIVSHSSDVRTETMDSHDVKIIGRCIRAEIDLTASV